MSAKSEWKLVYLMGSIAFSRQRQRKGVRAQNDVPTFNSNVIIADIYAAKS